MDRFEAARSLVPRAVVLDRLSKIVAAEWAPSVLWMLMTDLDRYSEWDSAVWLLRGYVKSGERVALHTSDGALFRFRVDRVEHYRRFTLRGAGIRREISARAIAGGRTRVTVEDLSWRLTRPAVLDAWPAQGILDGLTSAQHSS